MSNHTNAVIEGILEGNILGTFERYYHDDIVMSENGTAVRRGKAANREYEQAFVDNVEFHAAEVGRVVIDGDHSAVEWIFEFTPKGGERMRRTQVALQTWNDGKVVREDFFYAD